MATHLERIRDADLESLDCYITKKYFHRTKRGVDICSRKEFCPYQGRSEPFFSLDGELLPLKKCNIHKEGDVWETDRLELRKTK